MYKFILLFLLGDVIAFFLFSFFLALIAFIDYRNSTKESENLISQVQEREENDSIGWL